jgi:hypothetical protein
MHFRLPYTKTHRLSYGQKGNSGIDNTAIKRLARPKAVKRAECR